MNKITNYNSFNYSNKIIKNDFCSETFMSKSYINLFFFYEQDYIFYFHSINLRKSATVNIVYVIFSLGKQRKSSRKRLF